MTEFDELPMLLPYQQEWFCDESDVKVCEKSRRIGISWTSACKHVFTAGEGRNDCWYIGYSEDQGEEFIRDVAAWAKVTNATAVAEHESFMLEDYDPETDTTREIKAFRVEFASGCKVTALSSRPRNLRGKQGLVTIDEAAYHDDLPGLLKAAIALLMWGGQVEVISTHDGVDNEFCKLVESVRAHKFDYSLHRYTLDDALADGLFKRISLVTGKTWTPEAEQRWRDELVKHYGDGADEELFCIPSKGGSLFFGRQLVESRMAMGRPVLRLRLDDDFAQWPKAQREEHVEVWIKTELAPLLKKLPGGRSHYLGEDFGRTSDLTAFWPAIIQDDLCRDVPFVVELENVPFEQQKQVAFALIDGLPNFQKGCFDAGGNGSYLAEVCAQRYGESVIEQVKIGEGWHIEHWPVLRSWLEEGRIKMPSDERILSDFSAVRRVNGVPKLPHTNKVKVDGEKRAQKRHGDSAVAAAMLVMASREVTVGEAMDLGRMIEGMKRLMGH